MNELQKSLPWLSLYWSQLSQTIDLQRVPQALLITGNKGLGKQALAMHFAQSLLCFSRDQQHNYCGQCQSCKLFQAATHPDFKIIEPEQTGKAITISMIRQLTAQLTLKPQYDSFRVVIIAPADSLNNAASNAFLKYLEEPTERTILLLVAENMASLSATIRSRCQTMRIEKPDSEALKPWLKQNNLLENSELLLALSNGSPLLAKQFLDSSILELRTDCFNDWVQLSRAEQDFSQVAEKWSKFNKQEMSFLLFWLTSWVIDMIKLAYQQDPIKRYNSDLKTDLQELVQKLNLTGLYKYYDFLLLSQQRLETQINKQLMFEEILIKWLTLNNA